ncbi:dihydrofolate reductase [Pseudomonadota bacterium]
MFKFKKDIYAVWCRNAGTNIIGVKSAIEKYDIPWNLKEDAQRFWDWASHGDIVFGKRTYEAVPVKEIKDRRIFVFAYPKEKIKTVNKNLHTVVNSMEEFKNIIKNHNRDLYISGGSEIYLLFMKCNELKPNKILDSIYHSKIEYSKYGLKANYININESVDILKKDYIVINGKFYDDENVELLEWKLK